MTSETAKQADGVILDDAQVHSSIQQQSQGVLKKCLFLHFAENNPDCVVEIRCDTA